jgi:hypothetical protein
LNFEIIFENFENLDEFGPTRGGLPRAPKRIVESRSKGGWPKPFGIGG